MMNRSYTEKTHTNKGYSYVIIFLILTIVIFFSLSNTVNADNNQYKTITVEKGETLWKIAHDYHEKDPGSSIKSFNDWVERTNGIDGDHIETGQKLIIPIIKGHHER